MLKQSKDLWLDKPVMSIIRLDWNHKKKQEHDFTICHHHTFLFCLFFSHFFISSVCTTSSWGNTNLTKRVRKKAQPNEFRHKNWQWTAEKKDQEKFLKAKLKPVNIHTPRFGSSREASPRDKKKLMFFLHRRLVTRAVYSHHVFCLHTKQRRTRSEQKKKAFDWECVSIDGSSKSYQSQ